MEVFIDKKVHEKLISFYQAALLPIAEHMRLFLYKVSKKGAIDVIARRNDEAIHKSIEIYFVNMWIAASLR